VPIMIFWGTFFCLASPIGRVQIAGPIVLAQHKRHERIGKAWTPIRHTLLLSYQNSPINFPVLTGNINMFITKRRQIKNRNNVESRNPSPISNDLCYFRPTYRTLVFAGHLLPSRYDDDLHWRNVLLYQQLRKNVRTKRD
jgi:hypothetical protein